MAAVINESPRLNNLPSIGITGRNAVDGMGDLSHMLNVGRILKRTGVEVVYYIEWQRTIKDPKNQKDVGRLWQLVEKLEAEDIINSQQASLIKSKEKEISDSSELMAWINQVGAGRFGIFDSGMSRDEDLKVLQPPANVDFWLSVSYEVFETRSQNGQTFSQYFPGQNHVFLSEHGGTASFATVQYMETGVYLTRLGKNIAEMDMAELQIFYQKMSPEQKVKQHTMGIGSFQDNFTGGQIDARGLLLSDHLDRNEQMRIRALEQIQHPEFLALMQYGRSKQNPRAVIQETEFVPTYLLHGVQEKDKANPSQNTNQDCAIAIFANAYQDTQKTQILVKGKFSFKDITDEKNIALLREAGFTQIQYLDATGGREEVKTLEIASSEKPRKPKVLKLLSGCYLSSQENEAFAQLTGSLVGCSGDNTLQDAFSYGAIPFFIPHTPDKAQVLSNLGLILERNEGLRAKFPASIKFLKLYQGYADGQGGAIRLLLNELPRYITPDLQAEWSAVCQYVIQNFNLTYTLEAYGSLLVAKATQDKTQMQRLIDQYHISLTVDEVAQTGNVDLLDRLLTESYRFTASPQTQQERLLPAAPQAHRDGPREAPLTWSMGAAGGNGNAHNTGSELPQPDNGDAKKTRPNRS